MGSFTCFRGWSPGATSRGSGALESCSTRAAVLRASNGSGSSSNRTRPGSRTRSRPGAPARRIAFGVSCGPPTAVPGDARAITRLDQHRQVAQPRQPWEAAKIGGGTPPIRVPEGWLIVYHGVTKGGDAQTGEPVPVRYVAAAMVLDPTDVSRVLYRSEIPLLEPETEAERKGIVGNVGFPTAIDVHDGGEADVYYGMADFRIGAARLRRIT